MRVLRIGAAMAAMVTGAAAEEYFHDRWQCGSWRAEIDGTDGSLTVTRFGGAKRFTLPFGSYMSSHFAWNHDGASDCEDVAGACAEGLSRNGFEKLFLRTEQGGPWIDCEEVPK